MRMLHIIVGVMLFCIPIASMVTTNLAVAGEDGNLSENPGAEELDLAGNPIGWGHYVGAGTSEWGSTDKEAHSGDMSAYLTVTGYHNDPPQWVDWVNHGLLFGKSNGYTGAEAFEMEGDTEYYYALWIKEDCIQLQLQLSAGQAFFSEARFFVR